MITFELSADQKMAQSAMQDFAQSALRPVARKQDTESRIAPETLAALWEAGIVQSQTGDELARSAVLNAIVLEELAVGDATLALALAAPMAFVQAIIDHGSPAQHAAYRAGREIQAGRVWVNNYHAYPAGAAFGGYKSSGIGRENHSMMLDHYQQTKNLLVSHSENKLGFF